jgi:hypothetical protein
MEIEAAIHAQLERANVAEDARRGVDPSTIIGAASKREISPQLPDLSPREMVAKWRESSILGMFSDRVDSPELAEEFRRKAEQR